jgi:hypothetical protein
MRALRFFAASWLLAALAGPTFAADDTPYAKLKALLPPGVDAKLCFINTSPPI